MANQTLIPQSEQDEICIFCHGPRWTSPLWSSLKSNIRAALFPEKLPPLQLTSRPVKVRDIWGEYNYKKQSAGVSLVVHIAMVAGLIAISIMGAQGGQASGEAQRNRDPDRARPDAPVADDQEERADVGGGGGGGDRDKLQAPKGKLPKLAMEQITPPAIVIRNDHPKLPVEPTVVVPPQIKLASNMPNIGNPMAAIPSGPPSNGTGSGGGIGSGSGGGVGSGTRTGRWSGSWRWHWWWRLPRGRRRFGPARVGYARSGIFRRSSQGEVSGNLRAVADRRSRRQAARHQSRPRAWAWASTRKRLRRSATGSLSRR